MVKFSTHLLQPRDHLIIFTHAAFVNSSCMFLNLIYFPSYLYWTWLQSGSHFTSTFHDALRQPVYSESTQNDSYLYSINNTEALLSHCAAVSFKSWGDSTQWSKGRDEATLYNSKQKINLYRSKAQFLPFIHISRKASERCIHFHNSCAYKFPSEQQLRLLFFFRLSTDSSFGLCREAHMLKSK